MVKMKFFVNLTFFLITIYNIEKVNAIEYYQRITYLSYDVASNFHSLEVNWSLASIPSLTNADNFIYSITRKIPEPDPMNETVQPNSVLASSVITIKNSYYFYRKFTNYLLNYNGEHASKHYVAYNITPTSLTGTGVNKVEFNVRYFNCYPAAEEFKKTLTGNAFTNVVLVKPDKTHEYLTGKPTNIQLSGTDISVVSFLGLGQMSTMFAKCV
jgi:hypothetical protein